MDYVDIPPGTPAIEINRAIEQAQDGDTIVLKAGNHVLSAPLIIQRDNITVRGEGQAQTVLKFRYDTNNDGIVSGQEGNNGIEIRGYPTRLNWLKKADRTQLRGAVIEGDTVIQVMDTSDLASGDTLYLSQINTKGYLDDLGGCVINTECRDLATSRYFREAMTTIIAVDDADRQITVADSLPYDMNSQEAPVLVQEIIDIRKNISVSDLTITFEILDPATNALIQPSHNSFENEQPGFLENTLGKKISAIYIEGSDGANLKNISIINAPSQAFLFRNSINLNADNLFASGSFNKGIGGHGYGIDLYESSNNTLTNVEVLNMRHSLLFSSWHAEIGNNVHITNTNRDINFHGSPDKYNEVIVDSAVLEYGDAEQMWPIVSNGGRTLHHQTDIYGNGNVVRFSNAVGSARDEHIHASHDGASLNGNEGDDILVAGDGPDHLNGGDGIDTVSYEVSKQRVIVDLRQIIPGLLGALGDELTSIENLTGSPHNDILLGSHEANVIDGGDGIDVIFARNGDDIIRGGDGPDRINGQRGNDEITGGEGSDRYYFSAFSGTDIITDFETGIDKIDFSRAFSVSDRNDIDIGFGRAGAQITYFNSFGIRNKILLPGITPETLKDSDFTFR